MIKDEIIKELEDVDDVAFLVFVLSIIKSFKIKKNGEGSS